MLKDVCVRLTDVCETFPILDKPTEVLNWFINKRTVSDRFKCQEVYQSAEIVTRLFVGQNVKIQPYTLFSGLVILDDDVRIGPYNFIRGPVYIGKGSLVGPGCEVIRTIVMDKTVIAHKNLVADSILGSNINYGGMSMSANFPVGREYIKVRYRGEEYQYNGKYGATIEDDCSLGILTCTMPGCHIAAGTQIPGQCNVYGHGVVKPFTGNPNVERTEIT
jgi:NDP-sugar pyrophosphorylase family protein